MTPRLPDRPVILLAGELYVETQRYRPPTLIGGGPAKQKRNVPAEHREIMDATLRRSEDAARLLAEHYGEPAPSIDWPSLAQGLRPAK